MKLRKILSHIKWFFVVIPVGIFGLTSIIIFPIAWLFRGLGKFNPFWIWLDDEINNDETNEDFKLWLLNQQPENNFVSLYKWHTGRNRVWNLINLVKPKTARDHCKSNEEKFVEVKIDDLWRDGNKVNIYGDCLEMASYKWIDRFGNEGWQVNQGVKISDKYSTKGTSELWYEAKGKLYYRYSTARVSKQLGFSKKFPFIVKKDYYFQFKMGANHKRYILTFKRTPIKQY